MRPLAACPGAPACVSSQSAAFSRRIDPLPWTGTREAAMAQVKAVLADLPRTKIVDEDEPDGYIHAEVTTLVLRYVDDLEFLHDAREQVVHVRSASRKGNSDFGVNRRRVERIRAAWVRSST